MADHSTPRQKLSQVKVVLIFLNLGSYHLARARTASLQEGFQLTCIELARFQQIYPWHQNRTDSGVEIRTLSMEPIETANSRRLTHELRKTLSVLDPNVLCIAGYRHSTIRAAAYWAKRNGKKVVLMSDTTAQDKRRRKPVEYLKALWMKRYIDSFFVAGQRHREYLEGLGMASDQIVEGYDVVDNQFFKSAAGSLKARSRPSFLPDRYLLYVGRLSPEKNLVRLLRAFEEFHVRNKESSLELVLVGDGPLKGHLEKLIRDKNLSVTIVGPVSYQELPTYYHFSDALILPSISEPWGLVINEAMASARPVLVSNRCGAHPNLVHRGQNGYVFDPFRISEISLTIERIYDLDSIELDRMGHASEQIIERYGLQEWALALSKCVLE